MATYRILNLNGGSDITDPTITIASKLRGLDPIAMTVDVTVYFTVTDQNSNTTELGLLLNDVPVLNLVYDENQLMTRVLEKLDDYLIP